MTERPILGRLFSTSAPRSTIVVRVLVGWVFISEGAQKFLFPDDLGAGRFAKIGIPAPDVLGPFVGVVEVVGGALLLLGLFTRLAALSLMVDMFVAILSTKIPILIGRGFWGFATTKYKPGFWSMAHEARTDFSMLLGAIFLFLAGAGLWSVDARIARSLQKTGQDRRPSG